MTVQIPFFLSSATNHGINSTKTQFHVHLNPPLEIPDKAIAARAYIHSASIPYTFPNVVAGKNSLRVQTPLDANNDGTTDSFHDMTVDIPPGIYTLHDSDPSDGDSSLETAINNAVNERLTHFTTDLRATTNPQGVVDTSGTPNFCTLTPNYALNRVQLKLNHTFSSVLWSHADTTLDILGFGTTDDTVSKVPALTTTNLSLTVFYGDMAAVTTGYLTISNGTYTPSALKDEINAKFNALTSLGDLLATYTVTMINHTVTQENQDAGDVVGYKVGDIVHIPYGKYTYTDTTQGIFKSGNYGMAGDTGENGINKVLGMDPDRQPGNIAFESGYYLWTLLGTQGPQVHGFGDQLLWGANDPGNPLQMTWTDRGSLLDATKNVWSEVDGKHTFRAENPATLDKITEVGVSVQPLVKSGVTSDGKQAAGVLARFQLEGTPGSVMTFKPSTVIKSDISSFIGTSVDRLSFGLVDQNGNIITDTQNENWSAVMVLEYDMP